MTLSMPYSKKIVLTLISLATVSCLLISSALALKPLRSDQIAPYEYTITKGNNSLYIPYIANLDINKSHPNVTQLVFIIHGIRRNALTYYRKAMQGIKKAWQTNNTLVITPQFVILNSSSIDSQGDLTAVAKAGHEKDNVLFWLGTSWNRGNTSIKNKAGNKRPFSISSFEIIDSLIKEIVKRNPNITTVIIAGFSGGGQFVNRYAAGSPVEDQLPMQKFRYIVGGSSSYLYFTPERHIHIGWMNPVPTYYKYYVSTYNNYKYGLNKLNKYMSRLHPEQLKLNYQSRDIVILVGENDNDRNYPTLAKSNPAMLQGDNRVSRANLYFEHLRRVFGSNLRSIYKLVANYGHTSSVITKSDCALLYLYDWGDGQGTHGCKEPKVLSPQIPRKNSISSSQ